MSNLPSVPEYVQVESTRFLSAVSESTVQGIGGSVNYCLDNITTLNSEVAGILARMLNIQFSGVITSAHIEFQPPSGGGITVSNGFLYGLASVTLTKNISGSYVKIGLFSNPANVLSAMPPNISCGFQGDSSNTQTSQGAQISLRRNGTLIDVENIPLTPVAFGSGLNQGPKLEGSTGPGFFNYIDTGVTSSTGNITYDIGFGSWQPGGIFSGVAAAQFYVTNLGLYAQEILF